MTTTLFEFRNASTTRIDSPGPVGGLPKRLLDIAVSLAAVLLALPILLGVALLIVATAGRPVLFAHPRVGHLGRTFACYKFRTMVRDADRALADHLARNPEADREWKASRKLRDDPRVTKLGHLLRKSSLDELPQLINVLRGEMSCVGPRPIVPEELELFGEFGADYLSARPGMTGLWQVTGRSGTSFSDRVHLDAQYVGNWSLITDLGILARTTVAVIRWHEAC